MTFDPTANPGQFHGSAGGLGLTPPVIGMARTGTGNGYWIATAGGNIYTYGDAPFFGNAPAPRLPIAGIAATPSGGGYWMVA